MYIRRQILRLHHVNLHLGINSVIKTEVEWKVSQLSQIVEKLHDIHTDAEFGDSNSHASEVNGDSVRNSSI